jgi:1,4-dihydroxy-2-naphthoate octaprenyltransferase
VLVATAVTFALAVLCGIYLVAVSGWELFAVGVVSILAGVLYTGGPEALRLRGPGRDLRLPVLRDRRGGGLLVRPGRALAVGVARPGGPVGLLATAILVVNNVRDMDTDRRANKRTLAVRLGRRRARTCTRHGLRRLPHRAAAAPGRLLHPWLFLSWLALPLAVPLVRAVRQHSDGPTLNGALAGTGRLQLVFCLLLAGGILLS